MRTVLFLLASSLLTALTSVPVDGQEYTLSPESSLAINGTSSVNSFTCKADEMDGSGTLRGEESTESPARIEVLAHELDCGHRKMNRDLRDALKADEFPIISFQLQHAELIAANGSDSEGMTVQVVGTLTLAGHARDIAVLLHATSLPDGRVRGTGEKDLLMTDFGVKPPTALMGLVKARDEITIVFDLTAAPTASARAIK